MYCKSFSSKKGFWRHFPGLRKTLCNIFTSFDISRHKWSNCQFINQSANHCYLKIYDMSIVVASSVFIFAKCSIMFCILVYYYTVTLAFSYVPMTCSFRSTGDSKLAVGVSVASRLSLYVSPVIGWWPIRSVSLHPPTQLTAGIGSCPSVTLYYRTKRKLMSG